MFSFAVTNNSPVLKSSPFQEVFHEFLNFGRWGNYFNRLKHLPLQRQFHQKIHFSLQTTLFQHKILILDKIQLV